MQGSLGFFFGLDSMKIGRREGYKWARGGAVERVKEKRKKRVGVWLGKKKRRRTKDGQQGQYYFYYEQRVIDRSATAFNCPLTKDEGEKKGGEDGLASEQKMDLGW